MHVRLVLAAVLALTACQVPPVPGVSTPTPTPAGIVEAGGILRVALTADATTLDPWNANDTNTMLVTRQIFETLVDYDLAGFKIVPKLAETWSVSSDGRVWTFALRRGVKFHDGTDLDAAAVVLNFDRARQAAHPLRGPALSGSPYRAYAALLEGFDDASAIVRVEARDAATVVITTKTPFGPLLADLAMPSFAIVSPKSMRDDPAGWSRPSTRGAAGTGPFVFRPGAWQPGQQIALDRNPEYWTKDQAGSAVPYADRVVLRVIKDEAARITELRSGGLDAVRDVTPLTLPAVRGDPNLQVLVRPAATTTYLGIAAGAPFDRVEVRRAIAMAVDKSLLATTLFSGAGRSASQLLPPGTLGYDPSLRGNDYDPDQARSLMRQAGLAGGFRVEYRTWESDEFNNSGQLALIVEDLAAIGIQIDINRYTAVEARKPLQRAGHGMAFCGNWYADFPDSDNFFYVFFHSDSGSARGFYYHRPELDAQIIEARRSNDIERRTEIYRQLDGMVVREAPFVPLFHERLFVLTKPQVRGVRTSLVPPPVRYHEAWVEES